MPIALSPPQLAAVAAPWDGDGRSTIIVSTAGSGKTLTIAHRALRVARELQAAGRTSESVLCLCFGKDAQTELCERIEGLVLEAGHAAVIACPNETKYPGVDVQRVYIVVKTLNSLGNHILAHVSTKGERQAICGLTVPAGARWARPAVVRAQERNEAIVAGLRAAGLPVPPGGTDDEKRELRAQLRVYRMRFDRHRLVEADGRNGPEGGDAGGGAVAAGLLRGQLLTAYQGFLRQMRARNLIEFQDQILLALELMRRSERVRSAVRARYPHVLVDEFQDIGATELALIRAVARSGSYVGDPDQSIFRFKFGTRSGWQALHHVRAAWPDVSVLHLAENRRCPPAVVNFAAAVIENNKSRAPKAIVPLRAAGEPVRVVGAANKDLEVSYIAQCIRDIVKDPRHSYSDCVVISRKNKALDGLHARMKEQAPDVPVSRQAAHKVAEQRYGSQSTMLVALLGAMLPGCRAASLVEVVTALCPRVRAEHVVQALVGGTPDGVDLDALRTWHREHRRSSLAPFLRAVEELEEVMSGPAGLADVVLAAKDIVAKLGIGGDGDVQSQQAPPSQQMEVSSPLADEPVAQPTDGLDTILAAARKIEGEANRLRKDDAYFAAASEAAFKDAAAGEDGEVGEDDGGFFALISQDVRRKETKGRKRMGCVGAASALAPTRSAARAPGAPVPTAAGDRAELRRERMERLEILVSRARDILAAAIPEPARALASTDDRVRFLTVHKSKGREWKFVFVAGCDGDNFPVEGNSQYCDEMHVEEERRIFFVAATRALIRLTVSFARSSTSSFATHDATFQEASPFIKEARAGIKGGADGAIVVKDVCGEPAEAAVEAKRPSASSSSKRARATSKGRKPAKVPRVARDRTRRAGD
jgi:superfamily I DNA/RNA helicase